MSSSENILFNAAVRSKKKKGMHWWSLFFYYELDSISFKEKLYTYYFNLYKTGYTTVGETRWFEMQLNVCPSLVAEIDREFNKDYEDFLRKNHDNTNSIA